METVYIISVLLSIFFHCMGIFYTPVEASTDSCVFIILALMFVHKLKLKNRVMVSQDTKTKFLEAVTLCLAIQFLLMTIWFPIYYALQFLVDMGCYPFCYNDRCFVLNKIQEYAPTVCVLALESAVLVKAFEIDDLQRFYGTKDDLVSDSILSIVAEQQKTVMRRQKRRY